MTELAKAIKLDIDLLYGKKDREIKYKL